MSKSRFVIDKFAKLFEQGLLNYKDLSNEILNILKSKRDEICLLYTSDAADDSLRVDLGGRRIIKISVKFFE